MMNAYSSTTINVARAAPLALVGLAHAVLLWLLTDVLARQPVQIVPPAVMGELVSLAPVTAEPQPLPMAEDVPRPKPVVPKRPAERQPIPEGPPSEQAVTAPPEPPPAPQTAQAAKVEPTQVPAVPVPTAQEPAQQVAPPRSDAAFLHNPKPVYPALSKRLREQGHVLIDLYILADGSVGEIGLKRSSGFPRLDDSALEAVRLWRFVPAKRGNEPIPYWYVQTINFELPS